MQGIVSVLTCIIFYGKHVSCIDHMYLLFNHRRFSMICHHCLLRLSLLHSMIVIGEFTIMLYELYD